MNLGGIIGAIIVGLIVGALGRLIVPGKTNISILVTILIGIVSSVLTTWLLGFAFGYNNASGGIPWIGLAISALVAAGLIILFGRVSGRRA